MVLLWVPDRKSRRQDVGLLVRRKLIPLFVSPALLLALLEEVRVDIRDRLVGVVRVLPPDLVSVDDITFIRIVGVLLLVLIGLRVRRFASGRGSHKVCMKKVTFSDTDKVREYNPEDTPADPLPPDPAEQTLAGKRGRPPKPVELLSPLQLSEKRMKTAEETYLGEKDALFAKVIELKDRCAWLDHPSVVARLDERLDNRCRKVVELGMALVGGYGRCARYVRARTDF